ncbi:MAG TPA: hypothetical protein VFY44_11610, partial [Thermoleophilaceae bacterium]|nr:hypothetical protein [Thermoleophilaceae bacterium]
RLAVRGEPLIIASGKLEHREGVTNVVVHDVQRLDRGDLPQAEIRHIEPRRTWSSESGEVVPGTPGARTADLREVAPAANSFGRGRR